MKTLTILTPVWQQALSSLYDKREINQLLSVILEDCFGWSRSDLLMKKDEALPVGMTEQLDVFLHRLEQGEPVQHLTGFSWFDGLKIGVSRDVLIPRPETEELVDWVADTLVAGTHPVIADWCTGSGCIALALRHRFPESLVIAWDLSDEALRVASENARSLQLDVQFFKRDALDPESQSVRTDVIVSNPPYIPESDKAEMHRNVLEYDPAMALFVSDDKPLIFYKAITWHAIRELNGGGWLFFELNPFYADAVYRFVLETNCFDEVEVRPDLQGRKRMLRARRKP